MFDLRNLFNTDVVDVCGKGIIRTGGIRRLVVTDQHLRNGLADRVLARSNVGGDLIPLLGRQGLGESLLHWRDDTSILIHGIQVAQIGTIAESEIHCDISRGVLKVIRAGRPLREDRIAQLCIFRYRDIQAVVNDIICIRFAFPLVITSDLQCLISCPALIGSCIVHRSRSALNGGPHDR